LRVTVIYDQPATYIFVLPHIDFVKKMFAALVALKDKINKRKEKRGERTCR